MQWIDCEKNCYIFCLWIIDINDRFNIRSTISYYNIKHIKDNICEGEAKGNFFWLLTLKMVHLNNREFRSYDIAGTWDKQYVLVGYHNFGKCGQRIMFFSLHINLQQWIWQHQIVIGHRLKQEFISILWYFWNTYFIYFLTFFYFLYFHLVNISHPVTCLKLFNTLCHQTIFFIVLIYINY